MFPNLIVFFCVSKPSRKSPTSPTNNSSGTSYICSVQSILFIPVSWITETWIYSMGKNYNTDWMETLIFLSSLIQFFLSIWEHCIKGIFDRKSEANFEDITSIRLSMVIYIRIKCHNVYSLLLSNYYVCRDYLWYMITNRLRITVLSRVLVQIRGKYFSCNSFCYSVSKLFSDDFNIQQRLRQKGCWICRNKLYMIILFLSEKNMVFTYLPTCKVNLSILLLVD